VTDGRHSAGLLLSCSGLLLGARTAGAADGAAGGFSFLGSLIQMFAALAIVIGLILLLYYAANKWLRVISPVGGAPRYLRVLETRYLAPKQALVLVEVGGEYILIGSSPAGVQLIKQIDMLEEIDVIEEPLAMLWQHPTANRFRTMLAGMMKNRGNGTTPPSSGAAS
jgi:flagellar protein FliO/FliZ